MVSSQLSAVAVRGTTTPRAPLGKLAKPEPQMFEESVSVNNPYRGEYAAGGGCTITWQAKSLEEQLSVWREHYPQIKMPRTRRFPVGQPVVPSLAFLGRHYGLDPYLQHPELVKQLCAEFGVVPEKRMHIPSFPVGKEWKAMAEVWETVADLFALPAELGTETWRWSPRAVRWQVLNQKQGLVLLTLPHILCATEVLTVEQCKGCENVGVYIDAAFYASGKSSVPSVRVAKGVKYLVSGNPDQHLLCAGSAWAALPPKA